MEVTSVPAFLDYWQKVRGRTQRVADCIPAERLEWTWQVGTRPPEASPRQ